MLSVSAVEYKIYNLQCSILSINFPYYVSKLKKNKNKKEMDRNQGDLDGKETGNRENFEQLKSCLVRELQVK